MRRKIGLSEKIKITVVTNDEKPNGPDGGEAAEGIRLTQESAMTLMPVLLKNGLMDGSFCGGRGDCGRCVVRFLEGAPLPTGLERSRLEPEELRQGCRLACVTRPKKDCVIKIPETEESKIRIVTEVNLLSAGNDYDGQQNNLTENQKSTAIESTEKENKRTRDIENPDLGCGGGKKNRQRYIIAVDLGTTTIAMQLKNLDTGKTEETYCETNPQRRYGTDVLARIQAAVEGNGERLRRLVCEAVLRGIARFTKCLRGKTGGKSGGGAEETGRILCMCIAGNTAMEHLLLGTDVSSLGKAPFVPAEKGLQKITLVRLLAGMENRTENLRITDKEPQLDFPVYLVPCISAFVGGDIVAGLYALGLFLEVPSAATLFIDLGTNGEMALTDGRRMVVTATAAGPAFEGDGTMIGTDRIALTARLLQRGIADETGLMAEPYFTEGVRIENGKEAVEGKRNENMRYFRQKDIRALQMAKAAVRAGVEILWEELGCPQIEKIYLAGGFGYYLDVDAAVDIGLLPAYMRGKVRAVGNTSLAGAYELGRDLYMNRVDKARLEETAELVTSINLAETARFNELYLKYMNMGKN